MNISFQQQPENTNLCGQCCVAMILGCSLEEAIKLVGTRGTTRVKHLRESLEVQGFVVGDRINAKKYDLQPGRMYLARVHWFKGGNRTHWVVVNDQVIVDPAYGSDPEWTRGDLSYITSLYEVRAR